MGERGIKVMVTGGAGFIGSHISDALVEDGYDVVVIDDFSTGKMSNLEKSKDKIEIIKGDIGDFELLEKSTSRVEYIFHEAAVASVQKTINDPLGSHGVNVTGALNVLECARRNKIKRVIYATSAAVYGDSGELPKTEGMPVEPISFYGEHKLINEAYAGLYFKFRELDTVGLRYFNVFGPRQDPSSPYSGVISVFTDSFMNDKPLVIYGDGLQTRDFIYVEDVVSANLSVMRTPGIGGEIFNVGTQRETSLNEIIRVLQGISGKSVKPRYEAAREGDIRRSVSSSAKISKICRFSATNSFEDGMKKLYKSAR